MPNRYPLLVFRQLVIFLCQFLLSSLSSKVGLSSSNRLFAGVAVHHDQIACMHKAWKLYRNSVSSFAEALHRAWNSAKAQPINAQRIEEAQQAAGITEPVNTWAGWKAAGYTVEHGAKALFQAVLIHSSRGDGQTYRASFFGASQVQPLEAL